MSEEIKKDKDMQEEKIREDKKELIEDEAQDAQKEKNKGERKILKKLEAELKGVQEERDAFKDSYQRTFSEFNNYKKRNQAMASQAMHTGTCDAVEKILPVLDNLERALEHAGANEDDPMAKGVEMVYTQLTNILSGMGVKEIPADGEPFDPSVHQAIQQVEPAEGEESGTVATVVQKGYKLGDKILRHSMVIVNK